MKPAIVLHTHVAGLGVIRALGGMGVPVVALHYEMKEMGHHSKYVVDRVRMPHPGLDEQAFLDRLLDLSRVYEGGLLIPTNDYTLSLVSRQKALLERHFVVSVPSWEIMKRALIKKHTYRIAEAAGIPCPRTYIPKATEDLARFLESLEYPVLLKPTEGHRFFDCFGKKMFFVRDRREALSSYEACRDRRLEVMLQEWIPGDDTEGVNYNSYFVEGDPVAEFTARKVRLDPPVLGSPRVLVSKNIPEILETGRELIRILGFDGFSCAEFKRDPRTGAYIMMEVNGRHNLTTSLAVRCGINFPWIMYRHLMENRVVETSDFTTGVYWIDCCKDLFHSVFSGRCEQDGSMDYVRPYVHPKVFGVLTLNDPLPFASRPLILLYTVIKKAIRKLPFKRPKEWKNDVIAGKAF